MMNFNFKLIEDDIRETIESIEDSLDKKFEAVGITYKDENFQDYIQPLIFPDSIEPDMCLEYIEEIESNPEDWLKFIAENFGTFWGVIANSYLESLYNEESTVQCEENPPRNN